MCVCVCVCVYVCVCVCVIYIYIYIYIYMYGKLCGLLTYSIFRCSPTPLPRPECDTRSFLSGVQLFWIQFSFSLTVYLTRAKEPTLLCYLPIAVRRTDKLMSFPPTASSSILTQFPISFPTMITITIVFQRIYWQWLYLNPSMVILYQEVTESDHCTFVFTFFILLFLESIFSIQSFWI